MRMCACVGYMGPTEISPIMLCVVMATVNSKNASLAVRNRYVI